MTACRACGRPRRPRDGARGLCGTCYRRAWRDALLEDYPVATLDRATVVLYLRILSPCTVAQAATALDVSRKQTQRWVRRLVAEGVVVRDPVKGLVCKGGAG